MCPAWFRSTQTRGSDSLASAHCGAVRGVSAVPVARFLHAARRAADEQSRAALRVTSQRGLTHHGRRRRGGPPLGNRAWSARRRTLRSPRDEPARIGDQGSGTMRDMTVSLWSLLAGAFTLWATAMAVVVV